MGNVSSVLQNLSEDDFVGRYGKPKPTKQTKIIFSCRSGKRSGMVQEEMRKLGYKKYDGMFQNNILDIPKGSSQVYVEMFRS